MKEYDLDSYSRKWRQTTGIFTTGKGELRQGHFTEFFDLDRNVWGVTVEDAEGDEHRYALEKPYPEYDMVKIEYHPIPSGWYKHRFGAVLLVRNHSRGFQQGVSQNTHDFTVYDATGKERPDYARLRWADFLNRPEYVKLDPAKPFGILSDRLWWKDGLLFFYYRTIGVLNDNKLTLESKAMVPYIKPLVGEACQID